MDADHTLNLSDYFMALKRRGLLALSIALSIVAAGTVLAIALPDVYRSTAAFRLVTDRVAETAADQGEYVDQYVFGLAEKVYTSGELENIVRETDPYPELTADEDSSESVGRLHENVRVAMVTRRVLEPGGGRERVINTGFTVSFDHPSPSTAGKVAGLLARAFVEVGRSDQLTSASNRVAFFAGETERISTEIAQFEKRLADFKSVNIDRLPESAQANFAIRARLEQELDGVDREVRTLQQNRIFVAQQLRQAQAGPAAGNLRQLEDEYARKSAVYAETHPDMIALRRQIENAKRGGSVATGNTLQSQIEQKEAVLAETRQRYSEDHPDVRRLVRDIEALRGRVAAGEGAPGASTDTLMSVQLQTQLNALDTQIGGLQARAGALRSRLNQLEQQLGATPEVEREYQELTRGLDSARSKYNQMTAKRLDAEVEVAAIKSGAADRFTLFSTPGVPWVPAGPPRIGIMVVTLILAVILSLSAVVAAEVADPAVRGTRDVRAVLGVAPLAVVPRIHNSLYLAERRRKLILLAGAIAVGAPVLYVTVRLLTA